MEEEHSPFSSVMSNLEGSKSSSKHDEQPTQDDPEIKNNKVTHEGGLIIIKINLQ
jgi:hypothetical protein